MDTFILLAGIYFTIMARIRCSARLFPIFAQTTAAHKTQHDRISFYFYILVLISWRLLFYFFSFVRSSSIKRNRSSDNIIFRCCCRHFLTSYMCVRACHSHDATTPLQFHSNFCWFSESHSIRLSLLRPHPPCGFYDIRVFIGYNFPVFISSPSASPPFLTVSVFFFKFSIVLNLVKWFHKNCKQTEKNKKKSSSGCTRTFLTIFRIIIYDSA